MAALLAIAAYQRNEGATERVTGTVEQLTERQPRSLEDFARDHVDALRDRAFVSYSQGFRAPDGRGWIR